MSFQDYFLSGTSNNNLAYVGFLMFETWFLIGILNKGCRECTNDWDMGLRMYDIRFLIEDFEGDLTDL